MLKKPIKASRIANLTDARYFAAWEVQWLGFCLDSAADHFLTPQEVAAIKEWVEGPKIIGEFGIQAFDEIRELARVLKLDAVQVGPFAEPGQLMQLEGIPVFQEYIIETHSDPEALRRQMEAASPYVEYFLLNFSNNALTWDQLVKGLPFAVDTLAQYCRDFPILLDIPVPANQLDDLFKQVAPQGLSFQGGAEEKIGVKSFDELDDLFEALEILE